MPERRFKAGDKVKITVESAGSRRWGDVQLDIGYEFDVEYNDGSKSERYRDYLVIQHSGMRMLLEDKHVELVDSTPKVVESHKCHCPPENFRFNGIGCQCGGL